MSTKENEKSGRKDGQCRHAQHPALDPTNAETRNIWGRIGVMLQLTEQEFRELCGGGSGAAELVFRKMRSGSFLLDGETYFPQTEDVGNGYWSVEEDIELNL